MIAFVGALYCAYVGCKQDAQQDLIALRSRRREAPACGAREAEPGGP